MASSPLHAGAADRVGRLPAHLGRRHLALGAAGLVGLGVVGLVDPSNRALGPPCPLRAVVGLDCPLCGATRATHSLLRGDLMGALDFNALYVVLLPVLAVLFVFWLRSGRVPSLLRGPTATWGAVALGVGFTIVRNLPAFTYLRS